MESRDLRPAVSLELTRRSKISLQREGFDTVQAMDSKPACSLITCSRQKPLRNRVFRNFMIHCNTLRYIHPSLLAGGHHHSYSHRTLHVSLQHSHGLHRLRGRGGRRLRRRVRVLARRTLHRDARHAAAKTPQNNPREPHSVTYTAAVLSLPTQRARRSERLCVAASARGMPSVARTSTRTPTRSGVCRSRGHISSQSRTWRGRVRTGHDTSDTGGTHFALVRPKPPSFVTTQEGRRKLSTPVVCTSFDVSLTHTQRKGEDGLGLSADTSRGAHLEGSST